MAGGRWDKTTGETRPGTYTNFEDIDPDSLSAGGGSGGAGGGGGKIKPGDYIIGKIFGVACESENSSTEKDFVAAAEDVYCGTLVFN